MPFPDSFVKLANILVKDPLYVRSQQEHVRLWLPLDNAFSMNST